LGGSPKQHAREKILFLAGHVASLSDFFAPTSVTVHAQAPSAFSLGSPHTGKTS